MNERGNVVANAKLAVVMPSTLESLADASLEPIYDALAILRQKLVQNPPEDLQTWQIVVNTLNSLLSTVSVFQNPAFMQNVRRGAVGRIAQEASALNVWAALMAASQAIPELSAKVRKMYITKNSEALIVSLDSDHPG